MIVLEMIQVISVQFYIKQYAPNSGANCLTVLIVITLPYHRTRRNCVRLLHARTITTIILCTRTLLRSFCDRNGKGVVNLATLDLVMVNSCYTNPSTCKTSYFVIIANACRGQLIGQRPQITKLDNNA